MKDAWNNPEGQTNNPECGTCRHLAGSCPFLLGNYQKEPDSICSFLSDHLPLGKWEPKEDA